MINYSATFAISFLLSAQLQVIMGYDFFIAGPFLLSQPIIMAILSPFAGTLSDRIEPRLVASTGMGLSAAGLLFLIFVTASTSIVWIIAIFGLNRPWFRLVRIPQ
jgi:predicted MFS family arabinose efflux permease